MSNFLLGCIFLFPILPFNIVSILIILLIISVIFEKVLSKTFLLNKNVKELRYSSIFFFVLIITLTYSENFSEGLKYIQKALPFLIIPLVFYFKKNLSRNTTRNFLYIFISANFLFILLLYKYFFSTFFIACYSEMSLLPIHIKLEHLFKFPFYKLLWCSERTIEASFFVHKVYNSMHLLFSIVSTYFILKNYKVSIVIKFILIVLSLIFALMIINMVSLVNLFLFSVFIFFILLIEIRKLKVFWKIVASVLILFFGIFVISLFSLDFVNREINWSLNNTIDNSIAAEPNSSIDGRILINSCTIQVIGNNPILGVGIGDVQKEQNNCYLDKAVIKSEYEEFYERKLNAHNQYLTYYSAGGVILFIAFLFMLFNNIKQTVLAKNYFYLWLLFIVCVNLLFESMFMRMYGILFFCLFQGLLKNGRLPQMK